VAAIQSWTKARQGDQSYGNDRPYTIPEAEKLYGGGWVKFEDYWTDASSFGKVWKGVTPVVVGIVAGGLAGGPVGAVIGGISGATKYIQDGKTAAAAAKANATGNAQLAIETDKLVQAQNATLKASSELLTFDGPKLWALSILILMVIFLFFKKGKK